MWPVTMISDNTGNHNTVYFIGLYQSRKLIFCNLRTNFFFKVSLLYFFKILPHKIIAFEVRVPIKMGSVHWLTFIAMEWVPCQSIWLTHLLYFIFCFFFLSFCLFSCFCFILFGVNAERTIFLLYFSLWSFLTGGGGFSQLVW